MNTDPLFKLYVNSKEKYEVVPIGYSLGAFFFQVIWALWNGVIEKYLLLQIPIILILGVEQKISGDFNVLLFVVLIVYSCVVNAYYFPKVANEWREKALIRKGYELVLETRAENANKVVEIYAEQHYDT